MTRKTLLSTVGQRRFVRVPKLSSRQRGAAGVFARAEALGYKSRFPDPAEAQAFIDAHEARSKKAKGGSASAGDEPRDEKGRWTK